MEEGRVYEVTKAGILPATQAIDDSGEEARYLMFGELRKEKIIPIEEACSKCVFWKGKFDSVEKCQIFQKKDAEMRGFTKVICPDQFSEEG